jgi:tetratricopeptide (TPR) repeat protein
MGKRKKTRRARGTGRGAGLITAILCVLPFAAPAQQELILSDRAVKILNEFGLDDMTQPPNPPFVLSDEAASKSLRAHIQALNANYLVRQNQWVEARKALEEANRLAPGNFWIELSLAEIDSRTLDDKRALQTLDRLIEQYPDRIDPYELKGRVLESTNRADEAIATYDSALQRWPKNVSMSDRLRILVFSRGDLDKTIEVCKRRLVNEPRNFDSLYMLGYVYSLKARQEHLTEHSRESARYYEAALNVRPSHTKLYLRLAEVYQDLNDKEKAQATLRRGLIVDPSDRDLRQAFEKLVSADGDAEKVLAAYKQLAEEYPSAPDIQELYASQLIAQQKFADARAQFEKIIALQPTNAKALLALGALDLQMDNPERAEQLFRRAVELSPEAGTYEAIGNAYLIARKYDEAGRFLEQALERNPKQLAIYIALSQTHREAGQMDKAIDVLRKGLDSAEQPRNRKVLLSRLAELYEQRKEYKEALVHRRQAYEIDRTDMAAFFELARGVLLSDDGAAFRALVAEGRTRFLASDRDTTPSLGGISEPDLARKLKTDVGRDTLRKLLEQQRASLQKAGTRFREQLTTLMLEFHRYADAVEDLEALAKEDPGEWLYYARLATVYQRLRKVVESERLYEEARTALGADSLEFNRFAAGYHTARYENEKAEAALKRELDQIPAGKAFAPIRIGTYEALFYSLEHQAKRAEIEPLLARAERELVQADSQDVAMLNAQALTAMKRYDQAAAIVREYVEKDPADANLYYQLGAILNEAKKYDEAEEALRKALKLLEKPETPDDEDLRATVLNHLGYMFTEADKNLDEAEKLLDEALALEPRAGHIIDSAGWLQYKRGNLDRALVLIQKAIEYSNEDPILYDHLGDIYAKSGARDKAVENWRQALQLDPNQPEIRAKIEKTSSGL